MLKTARELRRDGSAALDLCYVACGRLDGYWEHKLKAWDVAAGGLIVREAGGRVTDRERRGALAQRPPRSWPRTAASTTTLLDAARRRAAAAKLRAR